MDLLLEAAGLTKGGSSSDNTKDDTTTAGMNANAGNSDGKVQSPVRGDSDHEEEAEYSEAVDQPLMTSSSEEDEQFASYDAGTRRKRKRGFSEPDDQMVTDSKKQSSNQHNENERKRRKSMKSAVYMLRDQLTKKTRKPAVNTVLTAAYEEIQDLKQEESEKAEVLEELKKKNVVLKYLLEKTINELKQQQTTQTAPVMGSPKVKPPYAPATVGVSTLHSPPHQTAAPGGISWQHVSPWPQGHSIAIRPNSSPPLSPPPLPLPPPPPLISCSELPSSPTYNPSPVPQLSPPIRMPLPRQLSLPPRLQSPPPTPQYIAYPFSPAAAVPTPTRCPPHFSPTICSPSSLFPFVPIPNPSIPIYYPTVPPNTLLQLSSSTGFPTARPAEFVNSMSLAPPIHSIGEATGSYELRLPRTEQEHHRIRKITHREPHKIESTRIERSKRPLMSVPVPMPASATQRIDHQQIIQVDRRRVQEGTADESYTPSPAAGLIPRRSSVIITGTNNPSFDDSQHFLQK